jgi:hypothetical protein
MNKTRAITILRVVSEITAAALFIILLKNQKLQLWIIIFGITALLSIFWGRLRLSRVLSSGKEIVLKEFYPGEMFGELIVFTQGKYPGFALRAGA